MATNRKSRRAAASQKRRSSSKNATLSSLSTFFAPREPVFHPLDVSPIPTGAFSLGRLVITPGAHHALETAGQEAIEFLTRHVGGDWGDMDDDDKAYNDNALRCGARVLSAYTLSNGGSVWVASEAENEDGQRWLTTLLLPSEY